MKNSFINKRVFSVLLTLLVVFFLFMLGPAQALIVGFSVTDGIITQGEVAEFEVSVEIEEGETLMVDNLTLMLTGPQNIECVFLPNGTLLSSCVGVEIELIELPSYGYGYGYGYEGFGEGFLKYDITLDSSSVEPGQYESIVSIETPDEFIFTPEQLLFIKPPEAVQSCSVRAIGGTAELDEEIFENRNRLNLYVPSSTAIEGEGSFTAQNGQRISYRYMVLSASKIGENVIEFDVIGNLRKRTDSYEEEATILLDKSTSKVSIDGETLDVVDMDVNFMRC